MTRRYPDHTRTIRNRRRQAILDAAAIRFGFESWTTFGSAVRRAMEQSPTEADLNTKLRRILQEIDGRLRAQPVNAAEKPGDLARVLSEYPQGHGGRPKSHPLKP